MNYLEDQDPVPVKLDSEMQDILVECYRSSEKFAKVFMPERFWRPFNSVHKAIFDILDNDSIRKAAIAAPRGIGKTSLMDIMYPTKKIVYQDIPFMLIVGASSTHAEQQTENLKDEITSNSMVTKLFGAMKSKEFSKEKWVTETGVAVMPRGAGQQVRGLLHKSKRPELIVIDDLENDENVQNEEQRKKLKEWFYGALLNSVDKGSAYRVILIGTVLHEDSLLSNLLEDPDWEHVRLSICGPDLKSNYPELMSDEDIQKEIKAHRERGTIDVFYREYMNLPIADENRQFTRKMFQVYDERDLKDMIKEKKARVETVVLVDPAKTATGESDYCAIQAVGIDFKNNKLYVRESKIEKLHPDELVNATFEVADRWGAKHIGIEVTGLNEFITYPYKNRMAQLGRYYELVELKAKGKKEDRIRSLLQYYKASMVYHRDGQCDMLEAQLLSFPRGKNDDAPDCLAYITEMLDLGDKFFEGPGGDFEAELKELAEEDDFDEDRPLGDWRVC